MSSIGVYQRVVYHWTAERLFRDRWKGKYPIRHEGNLKKPESAGRLPIGRRFPSYEAYTRTFPSVMLMR